MRFTKGPWEATKKIEACTYIAANTKIADVYSTAFRDLENEKANANLIAAAPGLYEALQNLAYYAARLSPPPYGHTCRWCGYCVQRAKDEARAALAKAEGKSWHSQKPR